MPVTRFHRTYDDQDLFDGIATIRAEMGLPDGHTDAAVTEAINAAARGPMLPPGVPDRDRDDRRDLELIAIDPPNSRDLDQAFGASRLTDGYRVHYAIADVASFVRPGGEVEAASLGRGVTFYAPDKRVSLHPEPINENAASLLPRTDRPCLLWELDLSDDSRLVDSRLSRALVRVDTALSYRQAQDEIDSGHAREILGLLHEIGLLRQERARERGAVSLNLPAQEIVRHTDGTHQLVYDDSLPIEDWNAQISLLTGMAAATTMLEAGIGLLRTLPAPRPETLDGLRRTATGLGVDWPDHVGYADRVRELDPNRPAERVLLQQSARGLGGAGYAAFTSAGQIPVEPAHSAIAAPYAHVTAPLRRVCDRYANEVLLALHAGRSVPSWVLETLEELPGIMGRTRQLERAFEREVLDLLEVLVLEPRMGERFDALVVDSRRDRSVVVLRDPAIVAELDFPAELGSQLDLRLTQASRERRHLTFEPT